MKNRLKIVQKCKNPEILVITPLKRGDKISKDTKKSIKRNKTPIEWISLCEDNNPAKNTSIAYKKWVKENGRVPYVIKIDNDLTTSRGMIDKLYHALVDAPQECAYSYCGFEFTGSIQLKIPLRMFDKEMLLRQNYISFNSLINTKRLDSIGGFITNDKYFRLLDWALWLKFLKYGFIGQPVGDAYFHAYASPNSVSCRSRADYIEKFERVKKDFIDPLINS